jgi:DNA-binding beta-propeller fold protein YncE
MRPTAHLVHVATLVLVSALLLPAQSNWPKLPFQVDSAWPQLPEGWSFGEAASAAVDSREHIFVSHRGPHPIMEFDAQGKFIRAWGDGMFVRPHGLKFDREGNLWVVDDGGHIVVRMDSNGRVRMVLGRKDEAAETPGNFNRPTDVAFAPNGDFYVTDGYGNSRVVKFTKEGRFIRAWGKKGDGEGEFNLPHAVAVDRRGRVYVGDRTNYRMQVFDEDGKFLAQWKHVGSPWGVVVTPDQHILMTDGYNNRILKLTLDGEVVGQLGNSGKLPGELDYCHHLAVGPSGSIYVAEVKNWRIQKFVLAP